MSLLLWNIIFLLSIRRTLGAFEQSTPQDIARSGSSLSDNANKKIDAEHIIFDSKITSKENSSTYGRGETGLNGREEDVKSYGVQHATSKERDKGRHSLGESEAVDQGKNSFEQHGSGYYKKGHRRTGFSNNYHKDESGNNSSFYEDSDGERGHRSSENNGGHYGQKSRDSFRDGIRDASYAETDRGQKGIYDNRQNYDDYRGYYGRNNNNRYNDDRRNYLKDEVGRYYDRNGNKNYYQKEQFYPDIRRNNDYTPTFIYSRYYLDTLPTDYGREDPYITSYSRDYRYFPQRVRQEERGTYSPRDEYYDRNLRGDSREIKYPSKYRNRFGDEYYRY